MAEKFKLVVRPNKDILLEEMHICEVDGWPADFSQVRGVFDEEIRRMGLIGNSGMMLGNATILHAIGSEDLTASILKEGLAFALVEKQAACEIAKSRVEVRENPSYHTSQPFTAMRKVDDLAKMGKQVVVVDYPLERLGQKPLGLNVLVKEASFLPRAMDAKKLEVAQALVDTHILLSSVSVPLDMTAKTKLEMRVYWYENEKPLEEWDGKELLAVGIIRQGY
ncbi:MAG: hypothetical protein AAB823_00520 [Patescibacteria group bacterium]